MQDRNFGRPILPRSLRWLLPPTAVLATLAAACGSAGERNGEEPTPGNFMPTATVSGFVPTELTMVPTELTIVPTIELPTPTITATETPKKEKESVKILFSFYREEQGVIRQGLMDASGKIVLAPIFDEVSPLFREGLAPFRVGSKWGYVDESGKTVIEPQYDKALSFFEDRAPVLINNKWGFINPAGQVIIVPQFDQALNFHESLASVKMGDNWGYIDENGQMVIEPQFEAANAFDDGLAQVVTKDHNFGFINRQGGFVIEPKFWDISPQGATFAGGRKLAAATVDGSKWGFIDKTGEFRIPAEFDEVGLFQEGLAPVKVGDQWGYIDESGKLLINPQFKKAEAFVEGLASVQLSEPAWPYVDDQGMIRITFDYQEASTHVTPLVLEEVNLWGYIDQNGNLVIPARFLETKPFQQGLAAVKDLGINKYGVFDPSVGKYGFIDTSGNFVISPEFDSAGHFSQGLARVEKAVDGGSSHFYIDTSGKIVEPHN